jgi:hypothetical protein
LGLVVLVAIDQHGRQCLVSGMVPDLVQADHRVPTRGARARRMSTRSRTLRRRPVRWLPVGERGGHSAPRRRSVSPSARLGTAPRSR